MSATRDQVIGKRAAVALMLATFLFLAIGPLWIAVNGIVSLAWDLPVNMPKAPGVTPRDQMAGAYPFPMPAWAHIVAILPFPVLLAVVWKPARHSRIVAFGGKLMLWATPAFIAFLAFFCGFTAFDAASWFPGPDGSYGLHWIAGVIGTGTGIVGTWHWYRTRPVTARMRRKRRSRRLSREKR